MAASLSQKWKWVFLALFPAVIFTSAGCEEEKEETAANEVHLCCNEDSPPCGCFISNGKWDPEAGIIQEVALSTLGTHTSCVRDGGQPYYQIRLGLNRVSDANLFACVLEDLAPHMDVKFAKREAWCSEAISYWHREAEIPYPGGFRDNVWNFNWRLEDTNELRLFYETEEAVGGRGRWIDWSDLDYENLKLGVNAPLPGAVVIVQSFDATAGQENWLGDEHSMLIDDLTVYQSETGEVDRITATIIEGDYSGLIAETRVINDLLALTPEGDEFFSGDKKIVGFGLDLDDTGAPVSDSSRLHINTVPFSTQKQPKAHNHNLSNIEDGKWESDYAPLVDELVPFIETLRPLGGPVVNSSIEEIQVKGIPDRVQNRWVFSKNGEDFPDVDFEIQIDFLDDHPIQIRDILLLWSGDELPRGYRVRFASSSGNYTEATVPKIDGSLMTFTEDKIAAAPVTVMLNSQGAKVRYIQLIFPAGSLEGVRALEEMRFEFAWGQ